MNYDNYFFAGTDGTGRFLCVFNNPSDIATADDWHAFFLWKRMAITPRGYTNSLFGGPDIDNVMQWSTTPYQTLYPNLKTPFLRTVDLDSKTNQEKPFAVICYERPEDMQYLDELGQLQAACEENMQRIFHYDFTIKEEPSLVQLIFPSKRREHRNEVAEAKRELPKLIEITNKMLNRVREIRRELNTI